VCIGQVYYFTGSSRVWGSWFIELREFLVQLPSRLCVISVMFLIRGTENIRVITNAVATCTLLHDAAQIVTFFGNNTCIDAYFSFSH